MARAKAFDVDEVLVKAMELFWKHGYERTSLTDLVLHTGVHKRSMYDTFGDKHTLYLKVLERYSEIIDQSSERIVHNARSTKESLKLLLEMAFQREFESPKGCLLVNTAVELAEHDPQSKLLINQCWSCSEELMCEVIESGQRSGEISQTLDALSLAQYFYNAFTGKLKEIINTTLSILN